VQWCRGVEVLCCRRVAEVQGFRGSGVHRCIGVEVQLLRDADAFVQRSGCRGASTEVQSRCRCRGAEVQRRCRGAQVHRCRGAECKSAEVQKCRSAEVQKFRSAVGAEVQRCIYRVAGAEVQVLRGAEQVQS